MNSRSNFTQNNFITTSLLLIGALASAALLFSLAASGAISTYAGLLLGSVAFVAVRFDRASVLFFLLLLPLFGNRPGSDQAAVLLMIAAIWQLVTLPRILTRLARNHYTPTLWRLCTFYVLVSAASLLAIPLQDWWHEALSQTPAFRDTSAWTSYVVSAFRVTEEKLLYGLLSVYWTIAAWQLGLYIFLAQRSTRLSSSHAWSSIQASLVVALIAGLLDYYQVIDLRALRALDAVVNPEDTQFRLQSWFGHSGWFAEFITLAAPSALVWLTLRASMWVRLAAMLIVLVVGELVLILTFQRGGWLAYPITLIFVWAAVYASHRVSKGDITFLGALRTSIGKIAVTLPLTLIVSAGAIWLLTQLNQSGAAKQASLDKYLSRAGDITRTSDRTDFMRAGFMLGMQSPILGGGSELFAYQYRREFRNSSGAFHGKIDLPLHGSAHNVYAQTFAGKGFAGLFALLAVLLSLTVASTRAALSTTDRETSERACLLAGAASGVAFLIYGNVQELFYIQPLQFLFFAIIGTTSALLPVAKPGRLVDRLIAKPAPLLVLLCMLQLTWNYAWPGYVKDRAQAWEQFGCFASEQDGSESFRWCGPRAQILVGPEVSELLIEAAPFVGDRRERVLQISQKGKVLASEVLRPGARRSISLTRTSSENSLLRLNLGGCYIPARDSPVTKVPTQRIPKNESALERTLRMEPSSLLAKISPSSGDRRCLAFRIWNSSGLK